MIVGLVDVFAFSYYAKFIAPMPMNPSIYGFALSLAVMTGVSLATKNRPKSCWMGQARACSFEITRRPEPKNPARQIY